MANSGGGGRKYGSNETSLDVLREIVSERVSRDDFTADNDEISCKVLKVFKPNRNGKLKNWIDFHLPYRGTPPDIVAFYGRVYNEGKMHIHSLMPDPSNYTDKAFAALQRNDVTSKKQLRELKEKMVEIYPLFIGVLGTETPTPNVGDIVSVRFPVKYPLAGGERVGIYVKKSSDINSPNADLDASEGGGAAAFTPEARKARPKPPTPPPPANIPTNILMVGDEMFSSNAMKGVRTQFAKKIQANIRSFYKKMLKEANADGLSDARAEKIAKQYWISNPKIVQEAAKKFFALSAQLVDETVIDTEPMHFTAGSGDTGADWTPEDNMTDAELEAYYEEQDKKAAAAAEERAIKAAVLNSKKQSLRSPNFYFRAWAWADVSFFSKEGLKIHQSAAGQPQVVVTPEMKKLLQNEHGKKWKKKIKTVASAFEVLREDYKYFNKKPKHEQPDFFILAGPVGHSAVPGWNAPLQGATKWDWLWNAGITGAGAKKKINYNLMMEYCRMIAEESKQDFIKYKKKHYSELLDVMFKYKNVQGGIIMGPPVIYQSGKALENGSIHDQIQISEHNKESVFEPTVYTWKQKKPHFFVGANEKKMFGFSLSPSHDPDYWYRHGISQAIFEAAKASGKAKDKVWTILPYKGMDFQPDGFAPEVLDKTKYKALWYTPRGRRAYAGVILEALCNHIAQKPSSSMPSGRIAWDQADFTKSTEFSKLDRDMRVVEVLRKRIVELKEYYGDESVASIKELKKQISELIAGYAKGIPGGATKVNSTISESIEKDKV